MIIGLHFEAKKKTIEKNKVAPSQYSDKMKIIMDHDVENITDEELINAIRLSDIIFGLEEDNLVALIPSLSQEKKEELIEIFFHVGNGEAKHNRITQNYGEI